MDHLKKELFRLLRMELKLQVKNKGVKLKKNIEFN